jgi:hypothetical protein
VRIPKSTASTVDALPSTHGLVLPGVAVVVDGRRRDPNVHGYIGSRRVPTTTRGRGGRRKREAGEIISPAVNHLVDQRSTNASTCSSHDHVT